MPSDDDVSPPPPPPPPPPAPAGVPGGSFAAPRALHPASIVLGIPVRQAIQGVVVPLVVGASAAPNLLVVLLIVGVLLVVTMVVRVLAWQRFRFSFDGEVLRVDEGVLTRNHRALDVARIQQVEVDRSLAARVMGLATLKVETAGGGGEPEVELRVIPERDAQALRDAVRASKAALHRDRLRTTGAPSGASTGQPGDEVEAAATAPDADREVVSVDLRRIVVASITGSRLLVLPAVLAALVQFVGEATGFGGGDLDPEALARRVLALGAVTLVALLIPASFLVATVAGVLRDYGWTMRRRDDDLHVTRGLLSTRESVVPLARVQLVEVQRNWIRRALGFATIRVHSAGGSGDDSRVTVPLVRDEEVDGLVRELLPGVEGVPALSAHPPNAARRAVFRWVRSSLIPAIALVAVPFVPIQLKVVGAALPVIAAGLGMVEYRQLAHGRTGRVLASRSGALSVSTGLAPLVKVQGVTQRASWFQRRLGLATVVAHVAGPGGDLTVLDLAAERGRELRLGLTAAAADPVVPEELADAPEVGAVTAPEL